MKIHYPKTGHLVEMANENRLNPTDAEKNFMKFCDAMGIKYRFQVPVFCDERGYILDFEIEFNYRTFSKKGKLKTKKVYYIVEIDGGYHSLPEQKIKDRERTKDLISTGKYKEVIRIKNDITYDIAYMTDTLGSGVGNDEAGKIFKEKLRTTLFAKGIEAVGRVTVPQAVNIKEVRLNHTIIDLKKEIEMLKEVNMELAKQVYDMQVERDFYHSKAKELNEEMWRVSARYGDFTYYTEK